jgi:hypothetical protein
VLCLAQALAKVNQADYVPATAEAATMLGQLPVIDWTTLNHKGQRQQPGIYRRDRGCRADGPARTAGYER